MKPYVNIYGLEDVLSLEVSRFFILLFSFRSVSVIHDCRRRFKCLTLCLVVFFALCISYACFYTVQLNSHIIPLP